MNGLKITLDQAIQFSQAGFEIECYVLPSAPVNKSNGKLRRIGQRVKPNTLLTISLDGKQPEHGDMGKLWKEVKNAIWAKDVTRVVSKSDLIRIFKQAGIDEMRIGELVHQYKCLRVVEQ